MRLTQDTAAQAGTPLHAIAHRWGFPRAADFTRAFRAAFGVPPREHRYRVLGGAGGSGVEQGAS